MMAALVVSIAGNLATAALPGAKGNDHADLVGVWELVEMHKGGLKLTKEQMPPTKLCFTGKEYLAADNVLPVAGSYRADTTKPPHMVWFTAYNGAGKGRPEVMSYELAGDTLRITHRPDGHDAHTAVFKRLTP